MYDRKLFRCYNPRFLAMALAAAVLTLAAAYFARGLERGSPARIALAVFQGIAMGGVMVGSVLVIRRLDELQQRIHHEALALAFAVTGALVTASGFLDKAGLPQIRWGQWVWPIMVGLWAVGLVVAGRRYR